MKRVAIVLAASFAMLVSNSVLADDAIPPPEPLPNAPTAQVAQTPQIQAPQAAPDAKPADAKSADAKLSDAKPASPPWLMHPKAEAHDDNASQQGPSHSRVALALLFAAAIGGFAVWSKRKKNVTLARAGGGLRVIDAVRVGPKAQLVVASVGGKSFVLAVTDSSVRRIASLEAALAKAPIAEQAPTEAPGEKPAPLARDFASLLRSLVRPDVAIERHASTLEKIAEPTQEEQSLEALARELDDEPSENAALSIAKTTRDTVERRTSRKPEKNEPKRDRAGAREGQAAGLMSLRSRRA